LRYAVSLIESKKEGNTVIRELSKILSEMGMRLNGEKTYHSDDIVNSSIKKDKLQFSLSSSFILGFCVIKNIHLATLLFFILWPKSLSKLFRYRC
jgi:hypothetical protein